MKKKFRTLLIQANSTLDTLIPTNLAIMSSILKERGNEVKLFDTTFYKTREVHGTEARINTLQLKKINLSELERLIKTTDMYEDFMQTVEEFKPDIVGLSAVSLTYPFGIEFLRKLKQEKNIPTIVGGIHATVSFEEVLNEDCVDYVCIGEGGYALSDLCDAIKNKQPTTNIQNIWTKKNKEINKTTLRSPADLDKIPFQDWTIFDEGRILKSMAGKVQRVGTFELDRGCPYSCTFCSNSLLNRMYDNKNYRKKNINRFIEEVEYIKNKHDLDYVYLGSESFLTSGKKRIFEFAKLWKERINLPFWGQTRPESMNEENINLLEDCGMTSISIGVESGSPKMRKQLRRHMSNETIQKCFDILRKTSLKTGSNNIIGLPDETREQIFETIDLNRNLKPDLTMVHVFNAFRGTPLYEYCISKGYLSKDNEGGDYRQDYVLHMPHISNKEILGLQRTFAMYTKFPKSLWPEINIAEKFDQKGNKKFNELSEIYRKSFLK